MKLKCCPFCGDIVEMVFVNNDVGDKYALFQCTNDLCESISNFNTTEIELAVELWNKRV